jgi:hypothetical protein
MTPGTQSRDEPDPSGADGNGHCVEPCSESVPSKPVAVMGVTSTGVCNRMSTAYPEPRDLALARQSSKISIILVAKRGATFKAQPYRT